MTTTAEPAPTVQRARSWRDEIGGEYEMLQVRLRCLVGDDEPEELL